MALIKCPECGNEVSDKAETCIHCGCPLKPGKTVTCSECGREVPDKEKTCPHCGCPMQPTVGTITIQTDKNIAGTASRYSVNDKNGNLLAELRPGETFRRKLSSDVTLYVRLTGYCSPVEIIAYAGQENRFFAKPTGIRFTVTKMN